MWWLDWLKSMKLKSHLKARNFDTALKIAREIQDEQRRSYALTSVAMALIEAEQLERAFEVAQNIGSDQWRALTLGVVAIRLAKAGQLQRVSEVLQTALQLTEAIEVDYDRAFALGHIAFGFFGNWAGTGSPPNL